VYFGPKQDLLRGKPLFMDCKEAFSSIIGRNQDKYIFWKLTHEFRIDYGA